MPPADADDLDADIALGRQIPHGGGLDIDVVQSPALVAVTVQEIKNTAAVGAPAEMDDPPPGDGGHPPVVIAPDASHPDIQDTAFVGGEIRQFAAVG